MIPKLRLNSTPVRRGLGLALACLVGFVPSGCQTDSPAPSNPSEVTAKINLTDAWKAPDQATWRTSGEPRAATLSGSGTSYVATIALAGPLQTGTSVWLALWTAGMKTAEIRFVQQEGRSELKQEDVRPDAVAMALLAKIPFPEQRHPDTLISMYAKALVDGEEAFKGFPANCPTGIDTARLIKAALVHAVAKKQKLSILAASWSLAIDTASVHARVKELVQAGLVDGSDTLGIFPPPPVRVAVPLTVSGALEAGGDLVDVSGRFEWDVDLGQITVDAQVTREGRRIETVALTGLSIGSGERFLALTGKARLMAGSTTGVGICSLVVVVRSERGDSARSAIAFEVKAASAPPQAPVIELVSPAEGAVFPFDSASIEVVWKVKSARSPVDTVFVVESLATKTSDSTWKARIPLAATGRSALVAVRARNAQGLWGTGSANFTRGRDQIAPDLVWIASGEDTALESDATFFVARLRATDASGIASVTFDGQAPDSVLGDGVYAKRIELGVPGSSVTVFVAATDSAGNRTEASRKATRKASNSLEIYGLPDTLRMWEDSVLEHTIQINCPTGATCAVAANMSDTSLAQVSVAGSATQSVLRIEPRPNRNGLATMFVSLSSEGRGWIQKVVLNVISTNDRPTLSVKASAMASPLGEVRIANWLVSSSTGPSDESGQKLRYMVVADSAAALLSGNPSIESGALVFAPKGISGTVRFAIVAMDDGDSVAPSVNKSAPQTLRVKLDAPPTLRVRDTLVGYEDQRTGLDTVRIDDLENPGELNLDWTVLDSALLPRANLRVKSVPGGYSYDALGAPDSNGHARIVWTLTDPSGNLAKDTTVVRIVPVNDAPVITKAQGLPDTILIPCTTGDTTLPRLFGNVIWEPNSRSDTGRVAIRLADSSQSKLFFYGLLVQNNGGVRLVYSGDSSVVVQIVISAIDEGGEENGGKNSSTRSVWIRMVDRVKDFDGNEYSYRRMPDGKFWMKQNLRVKPRNGDITDSCGGFIYFRQRTSCEEYGRLYSWLQAMNVDAACDNEECIANVKDGHQGLCPDGWRIATTNDWSALFKETIEPGNSDSSYNLKSTDTSWQYYATTFPTRYSGSGKFGSFLEPVTQPHSGVRYSAGGVNFWRPEWGIKNGSIPRIEVPPEIVIDKYATQEYIGQGKGLSSVRCVR